MKGDFSRWRSGAARNFNGVLPQQGKVLLDSDGIAQTMLANDWQQTAARDWVGACAGVPQSAPNSFLVTNAALPAGGQVMLTVDTGRLWADGLLVRLLGAANAASVSRTVTWLEPPIVPNAGSAADVAAGTVDTVVLEVWQRAVNGFALPEALIEPALGGPDTAERLQTECAFRLARLAAGETCTSLKYDESRRGTLNVSLVPAVTTAGDCPLDATGGYSGFEHQLYRVEIANSSAAFSEFKWSRTNGGLVGRGTFNPGTQTIALTANAAAVKSANQAAFYLEIEAHDPALGYTRVIAGAHATLNAGVLQLDAAPYFGAYPGAAGDVFFRLWEGIAAVSGYPIVSGATLPTQLENGIQLQFAAEATASYFPGDYWMFPVRAQGISNPATLIASEQPQGIRYHRVPLAEITWTSDGAGGFQSSTIEDCRDPMRPITQSQGCCTHRVGDGVESFGDFTSIQDAIDSLPAWGGEVCILPGRYFENVVVAGCKDVVIHGCGWQTRVASASLSPSWNGNAPPWFGKNQQLSGIHAVFTVLNSSHSQFRSFAVEAAENEAGILIDGQDVALLPSGAAGKAGQQVPQDSVGAFKERGVIDTTIEYLVMTGAQYPAILAVRATQLVVRDNRVVMSDERSNWAAIEVSGTLLYVERNIVTLANPVTVARFLPATVAAEVVLQLPDANGDILHPGGIQIGGPSANVYVCGNEIVYGSRNGITLGSIVALDGNQQVTGGWNGVIVGGADNCCTGGLTIVGTTVGTPVTYANAGPLVNIHIEGNTISDMGLCGIGPVAYFDLTTQYEVVTIEGLSILGNTITDTVKRPIDNSKATALTALMGIGAITVPDASSLTMRDNTITNFGQSPGVQVSGIFVLLSEGLEISRNQIAETRDWDGTSNENSNAHVIAGGIVILFATPPAFAAATLLSSSPTFEPGIPAVRIAENTVRVALGQGLVLLGLGPMAIVNNHFATGGTVANSTLQLAQTVCVLNFGTAIELSSAAAMKPADFANAAQNPSTQGLAAGAASFSTVSNGTVLFGSNTCQLEARGSGQVELASVLIFTPDSLIFSNNATWLDAVNVSAWTDALLLGWTLQVIGNRFQEPLGTVYVSGVTVGVFNMTTQNIATSCLLALPATAMTTGNIVLIDAGGQQLCGRAYPTFAVAGT